MDCTKHPILSRPFDPETARLIDPADLLDIRRLIYGDAQMMAVIAVAPIVLKDVKFTVGADDYEAHVSSVKFTPQMSPVAWKGLTPTAVFSDAGTPVWTCTISYAQDWKTPNSLAQYLLANAGTQKVVVFKPQGVTTGNPLFTATLVIVPGEIGGDVDQVMVSSVTMGVVGAPVRTVAP